MVYNSFLININLSTPIENPIPPSYSPPPQTCLELPKDAQEISKPLPSL